MHKNIDGPFFAIVALFTAWLAYKYMPRSTREPRHEYHNHQEPADFHEPSDRRAHPQRQEIPQIPGYPVVRQQVNTIVSQDPEVCPGIIGAAKVTIHGHNHKNNLRPHEARAQPNQRLVKAFGIHNSFVVPTREMSDAFRKQVEIKMAVDEDMWVNFATAARSIVQQALTTSNGKQYLFDVVQLVSLKVVRKIFWDMDPQDQSGDDVLRVLAKEINTQWLRSKSFDQQSIDATDEIVIPPKLTAALRETFPDWDGSDNESNPLNFILPGYETLWRVILRCFLEISTRRHESRDGWATVLKAFISNPTRAQLESNVDDIEPPISASMIGQEILRLYPPTRRVYRRFESEDDEVHIMAADIEGLQRDPKVWAGDPEVFRPERWLTAGELKQDDPRWLPFGSSPFRCPAKRHKGVPMPFGLSIIALLTGALLEGTDGSWLCIGDLPDDGIPLDTAREAYQNLELHRIVGQK